MPRLPVLASLVLACLPATLQAASVSSFAVQSAASMTLTGATSVPDGADLFDGLTITYALDQFDDFPQSSGNTTVATAFSQDNAGGGVAASASGSAQGPFGSVTASVRGRLTQIITNTTSSAIDLLFSYSGSFDGTATGSSASISGSAFVELQDFFGQVFYQEIPLFSAPPQGFGGTTQFRIGAGETIYASAYAEVFGDAFAFDAAQVPLPAGLPLLLGAVGGLAAVVRRRARRGAAA